MKKNKELTTIHVSPDMGTHEEIDINFKKYNTINIINNNTEVLPVYNPPIRMSIECTTSVLNVQCDVEINLKALRLLSDIDNMSLNALDDATLEELSYKSNEKLTTIN